ncbi:MAG: type IV pilin protein [Halothiobacillaceae bacterium]|jgi:type IV pilus assembly protein PilE
MKSSKGFTLIELMIAVAIVGILAAIAYPSYQQYVLKTRRAAAQGCLQELAQWMERYYTSNMTYANANLPQTSCRNDLADFYAFSFNGTPDGASYTLQAVAQGKQADDKAGNTSCSPLTLNHQGSRSPAACWSR